MSFGCSVSDIILCGRLAYTIYERVKEGPQKWADFAKDLHFFSHLVVRTASVVEHHADSLTPSENYPIQSLISDCWSFLWTTLLDESAPTKESGWYRRKLHPSLVQGHLGAVTHYPTYRFHQALSKFRLIKSVPKVDACSKKMSSLIEKLTAFLGTMTAYGM